MKFMLIFQVIKIPKYSVIAILSSIVMATVYPYLQVALNGGFYNYFFWFEVILGQSILNFIFYITFSILFGITVSMGIYNWSNRTCSVTGSASTGSLGAFIGIITSQCSACLSLASLFLPTAAVGMLVVYNTLFNLLSIGALVFSIYLMNGFKKISSIKFKTKNELEKHNDSE